MKIKNLLGSVGVLVCWICFWYSSFKSIQGYFLIFVCGGIIFSIITYFSEPTYYIGGIIHYAQKEKIKL